MAEKRYALLVANSASFAREPGQEIPRESLSNSVDLIRQRLEGLGGYSFGWPRTRTGSSGRPHSLVRQSWSAFVRTLEEHSSYIDGETLFLLYYFGHGVVHDDQLHVAFGVSKHGDADQRSLSAILDELHHAGVRKLIVIADHCHAGLARNAFHVQRDGLSYCVLAASQAGYTFFNERGGQWTSALSQTLETWNRQELVDRGLGYGTFAKWFGSAERVVQTKAHRLSPHWIDGGLGDHILFPEHHQIRSPVLGSRADRTIYNRLYVLLRMLAEQPRTTRELQREMRQQGSRVFLIASGADSEDGDRYISVDTIDRYLLHAMCWKLIDKGDDVSPTPRRYGLAARGQEALSNGGSRYNEVLNDSIYQFLGTYDISRDFLVRTMRKIIGSYDAPDVSAFLREIQYELEVRSLNRADLEFALRMLSQSGDFRKNTGNVFFPL